MNGAGLGPADGWAAAATAAGHDAAGVARLFDENAATYDRVNTVLTAGRDAAWRRWAAREALATNGRPLVLDACAGTGLLALALARRGADVTAVDVAPAALALAAARLAAEGLPARTVVADLADPAAVGAIGGPFGAATLGFGLRYFASPEVPLHAVRALLAPGGRLVVLESVTPSPGLLGTPAARYFFDVAPRLGAFLAGRAELYELLAASTRALGTADHVAAHLERSGFAVIARRRFAAGVVAGFVALRR
jgi:demethylmenaquinone methyltransferase/2-methoxy-6-polyprenyl-1,4-benzoquinol methylase